jgi:anti-sigma-K factor RskA
MTTNQDLHELTPAYALDALADDERRAFEAHLAGCERCRADLAGLTETAGALGLAADAAEPPSGLRDRILAAAREEGPSNVVAIASRRRRRFAIAGVAAAVAAAALAIGLYAALSGGGPGADRLALSVATDQGVTTATITGLDAAPSGKAYELWVIEGSTTKPAGLFADGGKQVVRLTRPAPDGSTVAVTLERAGGAPAPTTRVLVSTRVAA